MTKVGRSLNPALRVGILVARSVFLESSVGDPELSTLFKGDRSIWGTLGSTFSLRLGVTGRVGDLMRLGEAREGDPAFAGEVPRADGVESWPVGGLVCRVGVMASDRGRLEPGVTGLDGEEVEVSVEAVGGLRSDSELLRFRRTFTIPFVDIPLIEEDMDPVGSCERSGRVIWSWAAVAMWRSPRDPGRENGSGLASTSMDFERNNEPLGVPGSESVAPLPLLKLRNIDDTLLSPSCFDPSRCKLKPNRFRKEDAFDPMEPVFCDTDLV